MEKRISREQLKDVAIVALAHNLISEDNEDKEDFINPELTRKLKTVECNLKALLESYRDDLKRVSVLLNGLTNSMLTKKELNFTITRAQLGLNLLIQTFPANERKGYRKMLAPDLEAFWKDNESDVKEILYAANDGKYEDIAPDVDRVTWLYRDTIWTA